MIRIIIGDFNAKCGRELQYFPCIGKESWHCNSNDNGQQLIAFATSNGFTVSSTTFPHKNIHKATWRSPDGETLNQIDHILIQTRYRSTIHDVRSHRGADCDTDHYLVITKLRLKLKSQSRLKQDKRTKFNLELLRDETMRKNYENEVRKKLKENNVQIEIDVDLDWEIVSNAVKKAATTSIGELKRSRNTWYNDVCRIAVNKSRKARDDFIKNNTQTTKEAFIRERKICKSTLQRKKRKFFNNILHTAENDHTQGRTRHFFRVIKQYKQFNPIWNTIRDQDGQMLMEPESRVERWKAQPVTHVEYEIPESYVEDVSLDEEMAGRLVAWTTSSGRHPFCPDTRFDQSNFSRFQIKLAMLYIITVSVLNDTDTDYFTSLVIEFRVVDSFSLKYLFKLILCFIKSKRDKDMVNFNKYKYNLASINVSTDESCWRCVKRTCSAYIIHVLF
ncbi:hypothetical protein QTP88_024557 [Uroleucon formosanum]